MFKYQLEACSKLYKFLKCIDIFDFLMLHFIIIIIVKINDASPSGKTERLQNCRATPQAPAPLKKEKTDAKEQTTINCSLKTIQRTRIKHRGREIIPHAKMCRQKTSSKLGRPTPRDLKLTRMSHSRSTSMSYTL